MALNKYLPHVIILPEDHANRQIANGFAIGCNTKQMAVQNEVGGWSKVLSVFLTDYKDTMSKFQGRHVILLIDFDAMQGRCEAIVAQIPEALRSRVFIFGSWKEPEDLRKSGLGAFETIGGKIATDCSNSDSRIWDDNLLYHNKDEVDRFKLSACNIILQSGGNSGPRL